MKTKEVYVGATQTMVKIIDWTKINKIISKDVGYSVECRIGNGIILDVTAEFDKDEVEQTRNILIDKECCGCSSQIKNMFSSDINEGIPCAFKLFKGSGFFKIHEQEDGRKSVAMFPSFYFDIDVDDILMCLTGEEMPLYIFMESRYNYNPRIRSNEYDILKLVYHNHRKQGLND